MVYLLHGDDVAKTRFMVVNQQNKLGIKDKVEFSISEVTPGKLDDILNTKTLFGDSPFVVLDISEAPKSTVDNYQKIIEKTPKDSVLVLFSHKSLPKNHEFIKNSKNYGLKEIKNEIKPDSNIFRFLDALGEKNRKTSYQELSRLVKEGVDGIYILTMIEYLLRNLSYCVFESPKMKDLSPFVKSKFLRQSKGFSKNEMRSIYTYVYNLDIKAKTGVLQPQDAVTMAIEKVINFG